MGAPGCPLLALFTASTAKKRMALMQSVSTSTFTAVARLVIFEVRRRVPCCTAAVAAAAAAKQAAPAAMPVLAEAVGMAASKPTTSTCGWLREGGATPREAGPTKVLTAETPTVAAAAAGNSAACCARRLFCVTFGIFSAERAVICEQAENLEPILT
eukprot:CAMPEP_0115573308 /NCGR_PEP_ID=MMETSP0272-20121206/932_1 /TAXON_ID=71861 /ORGANISM="Scrippsiella trochoidea, Strain CCMP3099" /LENGTH=156 /DNA_ID=CAMNT_0003007969 /DNA_START=205 /DNA_END=675 /DNA_ORIENTATION=-